MHTAICTFENQAEAQRAVERLVESGFDRSDVHMEHRHADGSPMGGGHRTPLSRDEPLMHGEPAAPGQANDTWDTLEREIAVDPSVVRRLGNFFDRLFGQDRGAANSASYESAMDRGHCVVFVDAHSEEEAERAQSLLHGLNAADMSLFQRTGQRPLRDVVGERQATTTPGMEQSLGTARSGMGASRGTDVRAEGEFPAERERAMASQGWGEQRKLDLVEDDVPIASPDLRYRDEKDDKPR